MSIVVAFIALGVLWIIIPEAMLTTFIAVPALMVLGLYVGFCYVWGLLEGIFEGIPRTRVVRFMGRVGRRICCLCKHRRRDIYGDCDCIEPDHPCI